MNNMAALKNFIKSKRRAMRRNYELPILSEDDDDEPTQSETSGDAVQGSDSSYQLQHNHLLSCLEQTTVRTTHIIRPRCSHGTTAAAPASGVEAVVYDPQQTWPPPRLRLFTSTKRETLALASMARDDPPVSSTAAAMRGKVGSEFET